MTETIQLNLITRLKARYVPPPRAPTAPRHDRSARRPCLARRLSALAPLRRRHREASHYCLRGAEPPPMPAAGLCVSDLAAPPQADGRGAGECADRTDRRPENREDLRSLRGHPQIHRRGAAGAGHTSGAVSDEAAAGTRAPGHRRVFEPSANNSALRPDCTFPLSRGAA